MPIRARILRDRGMVTEQQLQSAIHHQVLYGGRLGTNLYELGFLTEERLTEALAKARGVPAASVDVREIQPEAVALVSKALAARHKVFPYRVRGKTLFLGRLGSEPEDQRFAKALAKRPHSTAAVLPVTVKGRVVNLVYGDNGATGNVKGSLGELVVLVQGVSKAYLRIIGKRIAEIRHPAGSGATAKEENEEWSRG